MPDIICFGQQPCGFFPPRYLYAKIRTARSIQERIGGRLVFYYHDSDHDYRETILPMRDLQTGVVERLNFEQESKIQKKYSPLYLKRIPSGWQENMARRLPRFVSREVVQLFESIQATNVADFCLQMYQNLGLLEGIEIVRSSEPDFRLKAFDLANEYFAEVEYEGETVRAEYNDSKLRLQRGGGKYIELPDMQVSKDKKTPKSEQRFGWMQSVVRCTHYVMGGGEAAYLKQDAYPDVEFVLRQDIGNLDMPWLSM